MRVLVSIDDNGQPCMTTVRSFSPRGQYVWLCAQSTDDDTVGWRHVARVTLLEVLGPSTGTMQSLQVDLAAARTTTLST